MFSDWQEALDAEGLPLHTITADQHAAAARTTARHATSREDLVLLLDAVGLPDDNDAVADLLTLLPDHEGDDLDMTDSMPTKTTHNAFEAMALSMHYADATTDEITTATGLTTDEITALVDAQEHEIDIVAGEPAAVSAVEELLTWAESHPAAGIRNKASRVRADIKELADRRVTDNAQHAAEQRVAKLKAELDAAQEQLRTLKTSGGRPANAVAAAPTPIRAGLGSGRSREELAAIRTWARGNGYQVADAGMIRKTVLDAYDAAHLAPTAKAS